MPDSGHRNGAALAQPTPGLLLSIAVALIPSISFAWSASSNDELIDALWSLTIQTRPVTESDLREKLHLESFDDRGAAAEWMGWTHTLVPKLSADAPNSERLKFMDVGPADMYTFKRIDNQTEGGLTLYQQGSRERHVEIRKLFRSPPAP